MMSLMTRGAVYVVSMEVTTNDTVKLTPAGAEFRVLNIQNSGTAGIDREIQVRRIDGNGTDLRMEVLANKSVRYRHKRGEGWSESTTRVTWIGTESNRTETATSRGLTGVFEEIRS